MSFRITGLPATPFLHLYGLSDEQLEQHGVKRYLVDKTPGYPDRIEMRDGAIGETMLLMNHMSQTADTPYKATHAIFVREGAREQYNALNEVPSVLRIRLLSLRAFDQAGNMLDADVIEGEHLEQNIEKFWANPAVSYIHVHNAKRGCYAGRIDRQ